MEPSSSSWMLGLGKAMLTAGSITCIWSYLFTLERKREQKKLEKVYNTWDFKVWWSYHDQDSDPDGIGLFSNWLGDSEQAITYFKYLNPKHPSFSSMAPLGYFHRPSDTSGYLDFIHGLPHELRIVNHTIPMQQLFESYQNNTKHKPKLIESTLLSCTQIPADLIEQHILPYSHEVNYADLSCNLCLNPFGLK